jgi:hypothetical protein
VHSLAETGEGDGVGVVPLASEEAGYGFPTPAPQPGAPTNTYVAMSERPPWRAPFGSNDSTFLAVLLSWEHDDGGTR